MERGAAARGVNRASVWRDRGNETGVRSGHGQWFFGDGSRFEEATMSVSLAAKTGFAIALLGGVIEYQAAPDPVTQTEFLERLATRVERASAVTPDTRASVTRVVERALAVPGRDA